jgi:hypothetical protein
MQWTVSSITDPVDDESPNPKLINFPLECVGCNNGTETGCSRYANPFVQHTRVGGCAMRTHNKPEVKKEDKLNPLKASKRSKEVKK